ncbi:hypothetical protein [Leifsonia sp. NPDC058248]|uniref:hypothetical protein n=1 Tax=Leifsonia sp. NPDC058248 TaxID=3346402 RepID=UPI0036D950D0
MNTTTDTHSTPPAYWFGVIEHNLRASMRDELTELGLRRGSWRILHTLADGPATAEDIRAALPPRRHPGHGRARGERGGPDSGRGFGYGFERGSGRGYGRGSWRGYGRGFATDEERAAYFAEHRRDHAGPGFRPGGERGFAPFASAEEQHAFYAGMRASRFLRGDGRGEWRGFGPADHDHDHDHHHHDHSGYGHGDSHSPHEHAGHGQHDQAEHDHHGRTHHGGKRAGRVESILDAFAERGWVTITDGVAELTPEGRAAHDGAFERIRRLRSSVADGISAEDYATTMATLEAMARNLGWDPSKRAGSTQDASSAQQGSSPSAETGEDAPESDADAGPEA